ncbi:unnamed protein product, partial [marine sediment metagenome]
MSKPNNIMIAEALDSLQSGLIEFLKPKLSIPEPDWKDVVEPSINPAFLPIYKKRI